MESFLISVFIIGLVVYFVNKANEQNKNVQLLKEAYEKALRGKNKAVALNAGRAYYQALRRRYGLSRMAYGTSLTIADEVSIMNEINTMM